MSSSQGLARQEAPDRHLDDIERVGLRRDRVSVRECAATLQPGRGERRLTEKAGLPRAGTTASAEHARPPSPSTRAETQQ